MVLPMALSRFRFVSAAGISGEKAEAGIDDALSGKGDPYDPAVHMAGEHRIGPPEGIDFEIVRVMGQKKVKALRICPADLLFDVGRRKVPETKAEVAVLVQLQPEETDSVFLQEGLTVMKGKGSRFLQDLFQFSSSYPNRT